MIKEVTLEELKRLEDEEMIYPNILLRAIDIPEYKIRNLYMETWVDFKYDNDIYYMSIRVNFEFPLSGYNLEYLENSVKSMKKKIERIKTNGKVIDDELFLFYKIVEK